MHYLKAQMRSKGYTQSTLARVLNVSLPTLKRWFAGKGVNLESLHAVMQALGVSFLEVASAIQSDALMQFEYTQEQEKALANNPKLLAYFDQLLRGRSPSAISKQFHLSKKTTQTCLHQLDKIGLVEWLPGNRARLKVAGEPRWRAGGPLAYRFKDQIRQDFLRSDKILFESFSAHDFLPQDREKIRRLLLEIVETARQAASRATLNPAKSQDCALFLSLKQFRWSVDQSLKD